MATNANQRENRIPAGAINPKKIYSSSAIAANAKVPLTKAQQEYVGNVASQRLQAQADAYFAQQKAIADAAAAEEAAKKIIVQNYTPQQNTSQQIIEQSPIVTAIPLSTTPLSSIMSTPPSPVKTAPIDTVLFNDSSIDATLIADLILENIGGQEILSIARYDTINGQEVSYQPIKNLGLIQQQYNPKNILRLQQTSDNIFANFAINLDSKIPYVGNGLNGENVYINDAGDIVIDLVNLLSDEQVEIEIIQDGTIYEVLI
jgi:hypothetical protein